MRKSITAAMVATLAAFAGHAAAATAGAVSHPAKVAAAAADPKGAQLHRLEILVAILQKERDEATAKLQDQIALDAVNAQVAAEDATSAPGPAKKAPAK